MGVIKSFVMALNRIALGSDTEVKLVLGQFWTNGTEQDDHLIYRQHRFDGLGEYYLAKQLTNVEL